jgi:hypothetical protein
VFGRAFFVFVFLIFDFRKRDLPWARQDRRPHAEKKMQVLLIHTFFVPQRCQQVVKRILAYADILFTERHLAASGCAALRQIGDGLAGPS